MTNDAAVGTNMSVELTSKSFDFEAFATMVESFDLDAHSKAVFRAGLIGAQLNSALLESTFASLSTTFCLYLLLHRKRKGSILIITIGPFMLSNKFFNLRMLFLPRSAVGWNWRLQPAHTPQASP